MIAYVPDNVWNEYLDKLTTCMVRKRKSDILIIGTDTNLVWGLLLNAVVVLWLFWIKSC